MVRIKDGTIEDCSRALQLNDLASGAQILVHTMRSSKVSVKCDELYGRACAFNRSMLRSASRSAQALGD